MKKRDDKKGNSKNHLVTNLLQKQKTFGQKASDAFTKWAGSWTFIIFFFLFLFLWIMFNTFWFIFGKAWDNKPFIMLNLFLSCLAAIQAPLILMSQNRQGEKDRVKFEYDYSVNRKAEREITDLKKQLNRMEKKLKRK